MSRRARERYETEENAIRTRYQLGDDLNVTMSLSGNTTVTTPDGFGVRGDGRVIARLHETSYGFSWTWVWATVEPASSITLEKMKTYTSQYCSTMARYVEMKSLAIKCPEQEIALRALVKQAYGFEMVTEIGGYKDLLVIGLSNLTPYRLVGRQLANVQNAINAIDQDIESRKNGQATPSVIPLDNGVILSRV